MTTIFFFVPHSSSFRMHIAEAAFQQAYPTFESTSVLDQLRAAEYTRLDKQQVYLDYTGGGLYAESQLHEHMELPCHSVFGNPHSTNPTSQAITELVEHVRNYVLGYFHASPDEYMVIVAPDLRVNEAYLIYALDQARPGQYNLFAYPAQSNFSGVQQPLEWVEEAHTRGWDMLVDCAAFAPTNRLDLSKWHPDFVPISFYQRASEYKLSLRTSCFCNPGAAEATFHVSEAALLRFSKQVERMSWDQFLAEVEMQSGETVRISLGPVTNFADAYRCLRFVQTFVDTLPMDGTRVATETGLLRKSFAHSCRVE
jgi:selenocysteine lyase/cysteine desulfurase